MTFELNTRTDWTVQTRPEEKDIASFFLEEAEKEEYSPAMQKWLKGDTATVIVAGRYDTYT